jgi:AraC-like DNA-binding protein
MLEKTGNMRNSADMSADPLSDILKLTSAESLVTGGFTAGGTWAIRFPAPTTIKFFAVLKGHCWVTFEGEAQSLRFNTGDVGLMTAQRAFVLGSEPGLVPVDAMTLFSGAGKPEWRIGDGEDFAHIGGHVRLDATSSPLLADVLPPWIHITADSPHATAFRWLLGQLVEERAARSPGGLLATAHLSQLLLIQILRAHMRSAEAIPAGWLRTMSDPRLAPALSLMHAEPARAWQLDELADACAMSRTTFALRFRTATGVAPLTYLTDWRMRLAGRALINGTESVASIALSLGYTSESAFSNAFKRVTGQSPRNYRASAEPALPSASLL